MYCFHFIFKSFSILFLIMCNFVCLSVGLCVSAVPAELGEGVGSSGEGVTGSCLPPSVGAGS